MSVGGCARHGHDPHRAGLVQTNQFMRIVDKQVEVAKKVFAEHPTNTSVGGSNRPQILDYRKRLFHDWASWAFNLVQNGCAGLPIAGNGNQSDRALKSLRSSSEASDGSTRVIWLPVSTYVESNGPFWSDSPREQRLGQVEQIAGFHWQYFPGSAARLAEREIKAARDSRQK